MGASETMLARAHALVSAPCRRASSSNSSSTLYRPSRSSRHCSPPVCTTTPPLVLLLTVLLLEMLVMGESDALPQHQQRFASDSYAQQARADPDAAFYLAIGLHVRNFDALERKLWHVSDPQYVALFLLVCVSRLDRL